MGLLQARTGTAQTDAWRRGWRRGRLPNHHFPFVGELSLIRVYQSCLVAPSQLQVVLKPCFNIN